MQFNEKLKQAMQQLGITQAQVVGMTGKGVFPWGYAVHTSENRWSYFINAAAFTAEIEGIKTERLGA